MATNKDWQVFQNNILFKLRMLQKKTDNGTIRKEDFDIAIGEIQSSMSEEEIAQVEKQIAKYVK